MSSPAPDLVPLLAAMSKAELHIHIMRQLGLPSQVRRLLEQIFSEVI